MVRSPHHPQPSGPVYRAQGVLLRSWRKVMPLWHRTAPEEEQRNPSALPFLGLCVSGGPDSVALAHLVWSTLKPRYPLISGAILHVDHGVHPESPRWAHLAEELARDLHLPFFCERLSWPGGQAHPSEADLRTRRYESLAQLWAKAARSSIGTPAVLVLGHHRDDELETVLLALLRGSHPLSAPHMAEWNLLSSIGKSGPLCLWRPLLDFQKDHLIDICHQMSWPFVEDPSNDDTVYMRNAIRHRLIPLLEELRPRSGEKIIHFFRDLHRTLHGAPSSAREMSEAKRTDIPSLTQSLELLGSGQPVPASRFQDFPSQQALQFWIRAQLGERAGHLCREHWSSFFSLFNHPTRGERTASFPGGLTLRIENGWIQLFGMLASKES